MIVGRASGIVNKVGSPLRGNPIVSGCGTPDHGRGSDFAIAFRTAFVFAGRSMKSSPDRSELLTRRQAIGRTLVFSTALLSARWVRSLAAQTPAAPGAGGMHLLAFGDFGTGNDAQAAVAAQMAAFAGKLGAPLTGVLALGDNFYKALTPGRMQSDFEAMYPVRDLPCPFYAILGNHDYGPDYDSGQGPQKAQMQLDYARDNPTSRWKLPSKWYALELPDAAHPLVKIIFLDSNFAEPVLTPQEKLDQQRFLEAELARPTRAPWTWIVGHHPLFSDGPHGDNVGLIKRWGPYFADSAVSMYLCGHDHTLQHLEVPEYKASFVVSGGGGAPLHDLKQADRGFAEKILGFNHLHVTPEAVDVQYIDSEGRRLHAFRRTRDGKVAVTTAA